MMNGNGNSLDDAALFDVLKPNLPATELMARRVRAQLGAHRAIVDGQSSGDGPSSPDGVVLRFADWIGIRGVAASIVAPALLPLGLGRGGVAGTLAMKGVLPKSLLTAFALPVAVLTVVGLTLQFSLGKTEDLQSRPGVHEEATMALDGWWNRHYRTTAVFIALLAIFGVASPLTMRMLFLLGGLVSLALCAETLSNARQASRRTVAMAALNITLTVSAMGSALGGTSEFTREFLGFSGAAREFHGVLLDLSVGVFTVGVLMMALVQGRATRRSPWRLLTEGTDRDLAAVAGAVLAAVALPCIVATAVLHVRASADGGWEQLWTSRANLAWIAFCLHALLVVKRAPVETECD